MTPMCAWCAVTGLAGPTQRKIIISRDNAYHGSTMAGAALGGMSGMHAQGFGLSPMSAILASQTTMKTPSLGKRLRNLACEQQVGWRKEFWRWGQTKWPPL